MIFKHLFRSKHQNPDPQVRIQAIENLSKENPQQKSVLHELAFNDSDAGVSLAALQKLDSFVLWYKMSEIAKNERVQKKSQQFVENILFDGQNKILTEQEKRQFILETRDMRLIEKLLGQQWIQKDTELAMKLLKKVDKSQLQDKILFDSQNEVLQTAILQTLTDNVQSRKLLIKLQKKTSSSVLSKLANATLQDWLVVEQKPVEVELQVKMILSRLLALKDHNDLLHIQQQAADLTQQYSNLSNFFSCLPELKRLEIEHKYTDITTRVERAVALLKPKWQAKQADMALKQSMDSLLVESEQSLLEVSAQLATRISAISSSEVDSFLLAINQHIDTLNSLTKQLPASNHAAHRYLEKLNNQLLSNLNILKNLPDFQQAIHLGQTLLENFIGLALPDDASQIEAAHEYIKEQKQVWRNTVTRYQAHIPAALSKQWNERLKLWQHAIKVLQNQLDTEASRVRNKLRAVESLINQGKYKTAMVLYQKVQNWFSVLPEKQQEQLERNFITVKEQIENLKDWQDYIAAPRKPALLIEVQALITTPLEIDKHANAVKSLRYQWNSLGKTDTESDNALNVAFETEIEKAFAPCREFYEQQQKQRAQNMLAKQQVLIEIEALGEQHSGVIDLSKTLRSVQQKWKNIGEVDFKLRNDLYDSYQKALNPLRDKVSAFYQANADQKQALLVKAEQLLELESVNDAIEQAKRLQQVWKTIEHAGKRAEAELWPAFRKVNDSLFAKKAEASQQEQTQLKQKVASVKEQVSQLEISLSIAEDKASVQNALQDKQTTIEGITDLPPLERKALEQRVQTLVEQQHLKLTALVKSAKSQAYQDLFNVLKMWQTDSEIPDEVATLSKVWQQCFRELSDNTERLDLTIKMEIVGQQDSPVKDTEKRQSIQMQLMAQKLQSGDSLNLSSLLKDWIRAGTLSESDITLLKRIEPLFVS
jgi:exonuclease SbcC